MAWVERFRDMSFVKAQRLPELKPAVTVHGEPLTLFSLTKENRVYLSAEAWDDCTPSAMSRNAIDF